MLTRGKPPETNRLTSLDRIQILPNEAQAAAKSRPGDLSEQDWYAANKHLLDLTSLSNNINARKVFAWAIFAMVGVWLAAVLSIVVLTGVKTLVLDKAVLITLITSGSVNVIGLFSLVARYLFHVHEAHDPLIEAKIETTTEAAPRTEDGPEETEKSEPQT